MIKEPNVIFIAVGSQGKLKDKEVVVSFDQARALIAGEAVIVPKEPTGDVLLAMQVAVESGYIGKKISWTETSRAMERVYQAMINQEGQE